MDAPTGAAAARPAASTPASISRKRMNSRSTAFGAGFLLRLAVEKRY
jgi:hypothetical protein